MIKTLGFILLFGLFTPYAYSTSKIDAQPGLWEISTQLQVQGLPIKVPPIKQKQCITEKDLVPKGIQQHKNCSVSDIKISANTVSWALSCQTKAGVVSGKGNVTYQRTSFNGNFQMDMSGQQKQMNMNSQLQGRYLGPCQ